MKNKMKYFLLALLMFLLPSFSNASSLNNVILNIPENDKGIVEDGTYEVYDITDIYNSIENKEEKEHKDLSIELRDKSIKELDKLEKIQSVKSINGKVELSLDINKSYLIKEENNYIIPVPVIGPKELMYEDHLLSISPKLQNKFKLLIRKVVEGTDYKEIPFNIVVNINGKEENIELKADEEHEFTLLPNDEYEVKEINLPNGYNLINIDNNKGSIENSDVVTVIKNQYNKKSLFDIEVKKILNNKELEENEFTFELLDEDGKVIKTAKNDKEGNVLFKDIEIKDEGEYIFKVKEINNGLKNIKYDKNIYEIKVIAKDNNDGTLEITKEENKEIEFVNEFIKEEEFGNLRIEKTVIDNDTNEEFEITVKLMNEHNQDLNGEFEATSNKKPNFNIKSGDVIKISHNEIITINKLPLNSKFEITEKHYDDYELTEKSITKGVVDKISDAHLYNKFKKPDTFKLTLKKNVIGQGYNENQYFEFRVKIGNEEQIVKLKNNEIKEFDNIQAGTEYEIEEINIPKNFNLKQFDNNKGIIKNHTQLVAINEYITKEDKTTITTTGDYNVKTGIQGLFSICMIFIISLILYKKSKKQVANYL